MVEKSPNALYWEEVIAGRLPDHLVDEIRQLPLTFEELARWQLSKSGFRLVVTEREVFFQLQVRIPIKKALAGLAGISGLLWVVVNLILRYLPDIQKILNGKPGI